jgi:hypothetical protein
VSPYERESEIVDHGTGEHIESKRRFEPVDARRRRMTVMEMAKEGEAS